MDNFAGIRINGKILKVDILYNVVDIDISKKEAERLIAFLSSCLEKEKNNG